MTVIHPSIYEKLNNFSLPQQPGFGKTMVPIMFRANYREGMWQEGEVLPYAPIALDPAAKVYHYGQEVFEGMKAYKINHGNPVLFRPLENWKRMNHSATRLCMPEISQELFMDGVNYITACSDDFIPRETNQSLYIRPFMIGTGVDLSLTNSTEFSFYVIASPSAVYHAGAMKVLIEKNNCRAALGGTGNIKAGGNYAAALQSGVRAIATGFHQSLWLDPEDREYIEELSGMNVFAVINNILYTPELTGSILPGITRDSIIQLARSLGYQVQEKPLHIDELIHQIKTGQCTEFFACGTAAIIASISMLGYAKDNAYKLPEHYPVAETLRTKLLGIQEGREQDTFNWLQEIPSCCYPDRIKSNLTFAQA